MVRCFKLDQQLYGAVSLLVHKNVPKLLVATVFALRRLKFGIVCEVCECMSIPSVGLGGPILKVSILSLQSLALTVDTSFKRINIFKKWILEMSQVSFRCVSEYPKDL